MASGCDPVDHVNTQIPYALLAGAVSVVALLAVGAGLSAWFVWPPVIAAVVGGLYLLGRRPEDDAQVDVQAEAQVSR
jgi:Na+/H+ antiporter NhaC